MRLYRVVSAAEHADIQQCGQLRPAPPSNQGKWLAERLDDGIKWGPVLHRPPTPFWVYEVEIDDAFASTLYRDPYVDRIGPARFVEIPDLHRVRIIGVAASSP